MYSTNVLVEFLIKFEFQSKIRGELSSMSFENLIKLKEKLGAKVYNTAVFGASADRAKRPAKKDFKRENKNRPREMTSKRPVPLLGNDKSKTKEPAQTVRDPRFDPNCGEFNATKFKENFSFVADIKAKELVELKAQLKESKDPKEIKKLKYLIQRMQNQNLEEKKRKEREHLVDEEKQEIKRAKTEMQMPVYSSTSNCTTVQFEIRQISLTILLPFQRNEKLVNWSHSIWN